MGKLHRPNTPSCLTLGDLPELKSLRQFGENGQVRGVIRARQRGVPRADHR